MPSRCYLYMGVSTCVTPFVRERKKKKISHVIQTRKQKRHPLTNEAFWPPHHFAGPGSFLEVTKIIDELPQGNDHQPAFHVVALSLPNFGFSEGSKRKGFSIEQYAETAHKLMLQLGYNEYVTQGGMAALSSSSAFICSFRSFCCP